MRHITYAFLILVSIFITASCSKEPSGTQVVYKIEPANSYIIEISYFDKSGNKIVLDDISQFPGGAKTITVSQKPFTAKLEIKINNTTNAVITYLIYISVDGQVKAFNNISAPPMSASTTGQIEYTVN